MQREIIRVPVVSEAIERLGAPTSALVRYGNLLLTCGMPPLDLRTGAIVEGDIATQARASLEALRFTLEFAGSSLRNVLKTTVFVTDPALMPGFNAVYASYFADGFPARTSVGVKPWALPFDIEVECIAGA